MADFLVVTRDFGDHRVGDTITDADVMAHALESNATAVVRVKEPDVDEPVEAAKEA